MLKRLVNRTLRPFGVRLVNASWGPLGFIHSFKKLAATGWNPRQIVDVGAWKATWTQECMALFPNAQYMLVDPLSSNRTVLEALTARLPNVSVWHGALGDTNGEVTINLHADQSSVLTSNVSAWRGTEQENVPMRTLDSLHEAGEILPPQLLKVDVQGFELEVLRGAATVLRSLDAVLIEVSFKELYEGQSLAHNIVGHMADAGFRIFDICSYAQGPCGELLQSDFLFVRQDWPATRGTIRSNVPC